MNFSLIPLGAEIFLVEELLDKAMCNHVIQVAESCQFKAAGVALGTVNSQMRYNDKLRLESTISASPSTNKLLDSTNQLLMAKIAIIQQLLYQHYGIKFPHAEACSVLRYKIGQYYQRHVDNLLLASRLEESAQGVPTRDISVVGYLNDDFTGGETFFDRQNLKVKPKSGNVLVFPAYYPYPHESLPIISGQKYAFNSWLFHGVH